MRSAFGTNSGARLAPTPNARVTASRRRTAVLAAVIALAALAAGVGVITAPTDPAGSAAATGPFSYFPS